MIIGIPKELLSGERRVAAVPGLVAMLQKTGLEVIVELGAGSGAHFADAEYEQAGAKTAANAAALYGQADLVAKVHKPTDAEVELLREGSVLICFLQPSTSQPLIQKLAGKKITVLAMEMIPRISRAQSMDALSSQAGIAGYKAVLIAAAALGKFLPMLTTAAGTLRPSKVLVLGAGVAGLQAIATAKRLGAVVWAYDVRAAVKEQIESLGGKFLELDIGEKDAEGTGGYAKELTEEAKRRQQQALAEKTKEFDVVITTAQIPGKRAPLLVTKETVAGMQPGSVIVDLAAESGGNCGLTEAGKEVTANGVTIIGPVNLPSTMPIHASQMYARNIVELVKLLVKDGKLNVDLNDEVIKGACLTHDGKEMQR